MGVGVAENTPWEDEAAEQAGAIPQGGD